MINYNDNTNDKWTKRDILSALGLYAIIGALIVVVFCIGRALGIPEFQI